MSASKVAAAVGLSPYESPFSLYHRMAGLIPQPAQTAVMSRGHYLESGVAAWWADQHPEYDVLRGQSYLHETRDWQVAAPDRLLALGADAEVTSLLEIKTARDADDDEWGPAGSDQIPVGYRCQVLWQMSTLGVDTAHVAVLLPYLEFRDYVIEYDAADADALVAAARSFIDEDIEACERIQMAMRAERFVVGPLAQHHERPIEAFQQHLLDRLAAD